MINLPTIRGCRQYHFTATCCGFALHAHLNKLALHLLSTHRCSEDLTSTVIIKPFLDMAKYVFASPISSVLRLVPFYIHREVMKTETSGIYSSFSSKQSTLQFNLWPVNPECTLKHHSGKHSASAKVHWKATPAK